MNNGHFGFSCGGFPIPHLCACLPPWVWVNQKVKGRYVSEEVIPWVGELVSVSWEVGGSRGNDIFILLYCILKVFI